MIYTDRDTDTVRVNVLPQDGPVLWDRGGERRIILSAMIRNARYLLSSWEEAVLAGLHVEVPASAQVIKWDDCLGLPDPPSRVKVTHQPQLDLGEQKSTPGR